MGRDRNRVQVRALGVLHGLLRVRGFSQDDAHIFCRPDQIREEVSEVLHLTLDFLRTFWV